MKCICLKVSLNDPNNKATPELTSVALSKESYDLLRGLYHFLEISTIENNFQLKAGLIDAFWMESIDDHTEISAKKISELENKLDEDNYCLDTELDIEDGAEVEDFAVCVSSSGIYLTCEYEGESYSSEAFLDEAFFNLEVDDSDEVEEESSEA